MCVCVFFRMARVCRNGNSGESLRYGIVSFPTKEKAAEAIQAMNGHQIFSKAIECSFELSGSDSESESISSRRSSTDSDDGKVMKKKRKKKN